MAYSRRSVGGRRRVKRRTTRGGRFMFTRPWHSFKKGVGKRLSKHSKHSFRKYYDENPSKKRAAKLKELKVATDNANRWTTRASNTAKSLGKGTVNTVTYLPRAIGRGTGTLYNYLTRSRTR